MTPPAFFRNGTPASNLKRELHNLEPVSYQGLPIQAYDDLLNSYCIKDMYDLGTGDANAAKACLVNRKCYVCLCKSDFHVKTVYAELINFVKSLFEKIHFDALPV